MTVNTQCQMLCDKLSNQMTLLSVWGLFFMCYLPPHFAVILYHVVVFLFFYFDYYNYFLSSNFLTNKKSNNNCYCCDITLSRQQQQHQNIRNKRILLVLLSMISVDSKCRRRRCRRRYYSRHLTNWHGRSRLTTSSCYQLQLSICFNSFVLHLLLLLLFCTISKEIYNICLVVVIVS